MHARRIFRRFTLPTTTLGVIAALALALAVAPATPAAAAPPAPGCEVLHNGATCTIGAADGPQQVVLAADVIAVTVIVAAGAGGTGSSRIGGDMVVAEITDIHPSRTLAMTVGRAGAVGSSSAVSWNDPPMTDPLIVAQGGRSKLTSVVDSTRVGFARIMLGEIAADGEVTLIAGEAVAHGCVDSSDPRTHAVPDDVEAYYVIAAGGGGTHLSNGSGTEGRGAAVRGQIAVQGVDEFEYWVGCSAANFGAAGFGRAGSGGSAGTGANNGGDGGGATMLGVAGPNGLVPYIAAGGGGGSGGDANCGIGYCDRGGNGGNGGGVRGTLRPLAGDDGNIDFYFATGGCGACSDRLHGDHDGTSAFDGGGGGGGGAGYPRSGHGGGSRGASPGGGGGAGGSYTAPELVSGSVVTTMAAAQNGFLMLVALTVPTTTLTVNKVLTGDGAAHGDAVFTMHAVCTRAGGAGLDETFQIAAGIPIVLDGVPQQSSCTVTETDSGGASTPAAPQTVEVGQTPASVTLTNEFATGAFDVAVTSITRDTAGDTVTGVVMDAGPLRFGVACVLDGRRIPLPADVGVLTFDGAATFAGGVTKAVTGVPIGAVCEISPFPSPAATAFRVNGAPQDGDAAHITVAATRGAVDVTESFPLAPLSVSLTIEGSGAPPPGYLYAFTADCRYNGQPVTAAQSFSIRVAAGATAPSLALVPVGASCTLTEKDTGGASATSYPDGATVTVGTGGAVVPVVNHFTADPLAVAIRTSGAGAAWANVDIAVTVGCEVAGVALPFVSFTVPAAGGVHTLDIDDGAQCAVSTVGDAGQSRVRFASSSNAAWSDTPVTVEVGAGVTHLSVDVVFDAAPIGVSSANTGAGARFANVATAATISDCTFNGSPAAVGGEASAILPFAIAGGSTAVPMVVGASCRVEQSTSGGASSVRFTTVDGSADATGATVTVADVDGAHVDIENVFEVAALSVTQVVTGDAAWAANTDTRVDVACTFNGTPLGIGAGGVAHARFTPSGVPISSGADGALGALPVGAVCTAVESEDGGATVVSYAPASATMAPGAGIVVTNRFDASEYSVEAALGGNAASAHQDDVFAFTQACTFNGIAVAAPQTTPAWSAHIEMAAGAPVVFDGLPVGAECTLTENGTSHATTVLPAAQQTVTLPGAVARGVARVDVAFTMVFDATTVNLQQAVAGPGAATYGAGAIFTDRLVCAYADDGTRVLLDDDGIADLADGGSAAFAVPLGADCEVTQHNTELSTTQTLPRGVAGAEPLTLTAVNTYLLGGFTVASEARGTDADQARLGFTASCVAADGSTALPLNADAAASFRLRDGQAYTFDALAGATCTVTETDTHRALEVVVRASGTGAAVSGVAGSAVADPDVAAVLAFRTYLAGSLPPTGAAVGGGALVAALLVVCGALLLAVRRRHTRDRHPITRT